VFRHHDITHYSKPIFLPHFLERALKHLSGFRLHEVSLPVIAAKGDEVEISAILKAVQSDGHAPECTTFGGQTKAPVSATNRVADTGAKERYFV
jgi:hypothetical protein